MRIDMETDRCGFCTKSTFLMHFCYLGGLPTVSQWNASQFAWIFAFASFAGSLLETHVNVCGAAYDADEGHIGVIWLCLKGIVGLF